MQQAAKYAILLLEAEKASLVVFEGNVQAYRVLGIGSMDQSVTIRGKNASYDIRVRAGEYMLIGAKEDNLSFEGGERLLKINED